MVCLPLGRAVALTMAMVLLFSALPLGAAKAALITTDRVIGDRLIGDQQIGDQRIREQAGGERDRLDAFVQRQDVRRQMIAFGVEPAEAVARVASLSDQEVRQIVGQIDSLPAGQSAIGVVVGAAVLVFLVLLVTDLLGLTHIFPFVNHPR